MRTARPLISKFLFSGFCLAGSFACDRSHAAIIEAGKIVLVKGDVFILGAKDKSVVADPAGKRGRSTQKGSPFYNGETIQTKDGARVKLLFTEGGNEIVLGSSTSLVVERSGGAKPGTELSLRQGTVRSTVNRKYTGEAGDIFEVKTPNSVAGVRGTIFNVAYDSGANSTQVLTERGSVAVAPINTLDNRPSQKPILVNAGMYSEVSKGNTPSAPAIATPEMIKNANPETSSNDSKGASAPAKQTSSTSEKTPTVAMAPDPVTTDVRAPASVNAKSESTSPSTMNSPSATNSGQMALAATKPMDIVNGQASSMRQAAQDQLSQQRLTQGVRADVLFQIK